MRTSEISRQTNETQIQIQLDLDGTGKHEISTGVGFLDHMLTHLAVHGLFDLIVHAKGDLHIDVHHTVEDVALGLGQAFDQALGDRKGIVRMGDTRGTRSAYTTGRKQNDCGGHFSANIRATHAPRRLLTPHGCSKGQPFPRPSACTPVLE